MDVREYTNIVIEKNGEFLVSYDSIRNTLRWSTSPYDAWMTRSKDKALMVSGRVHGTCFLFNPVVNQLRRMML